MIEPPLIDRLAGMEVYASQSQPCWAKMKSRTDDFHVEETLAVKFLPESDGKSFPVYRVVKQRIDTFHLERELSAILGSRMKFVGLKDKKAVAVQYASPTSLNSATPHVVERENFSAELVGYLSRPISGADIAGNHFRVILRDCCPEIGPAVREVFELAKETRLPNFYGLQRFGADGTLTYRVGAALVKGDFKRAVEILLTEPRTNDSPDTLEAREQIARGNIADGARLLNEGSDIEKLVANRLSRRPGDFIGALRAIPIKLRRFLPQAYQSYIFNRTLSRALQRGLDISRAHPGDNWEEVTPDGSGTRKVHGVREPQNAGAVPLVQLVGFSYRNYASRFDSCTEEIMAEEGVSPRQFYLQDMQEASPEGGFRRPSLAASNMSFGLEGENEASLRFSLARGQYATVFVREMVKPSSPDAQGFA
jgi:tRNA pseudouridine13 synthase